VIDFLTALGQGDRSKGEEEFVRRHPSVEQLSQLYGDARAAAQEAGEAYAADCCHETHTAMNAARSAFEAAALRCAVGVADALEAEGLAVPEEWLRHVLVKNGPRC
jgi:hypothetical protein